MFLKKDKTLSFRKKMKALLFLKSMKDLFSKKVNSYDPGNDVYRFLSVVHSKVLRVHRQNVLQRNDTIHLQFLKVFLLLAI